MREQMVAESVERLTAVADPGLFDRVELGQRAVERGVDEDRIVPEAVDPTRRWREDAVNRAGGFVHDEVASGDGNRADKARGAAVAASYREEVADLREPPGGIGP